MEEWKKYFKKKPKWYGKKPLRARDVVGALPMTKKRKHEWLLDALGKERYEKRYGKVRSR